MAERRSSEAFRLARLCDHTPADYEANRRVIDGYARLDTFSPGSINWLIPHFESILIGGVRTIAMFADYFRKAKGVQCRLLVYHPTDDAETYYQRLARAFSEFPREHVIALSEDSVEDIPDADAIIATFWSSAHLAFKFNRTAAKFYFVQDFEPIFYPSGTLAALSMETYHFGFYGICNSPGVAEAYRDVSRTPSITFWPALDHKVFRPLAPGEPKHKPGEPKQIVFYGRPQRPRNAFELGAEVLTRVKAVLGNDVRIVSAGAEWRPSEYGLGGVVDVLGLLPSLESVAELYRRCDAGLIFMMTRHPSYQPLEYMACGCPTVTNINPANRWFFRHRDNCFLCQPSISCLVDGLLAVLQDEHLSARIVEGGYATVACTSWEREMERVWAFLCKRPFT